MSKLQPVVVALDIGGTKLAAAVIDLEGGVSRYRTLPTKPEQGPEAVLDRALGLVGEVLDEQEQSGVAPAVIGVSTKGVTSEEGVFGSGMPDWSGLRVPGAARQRFPAAKVVIVNDVRAATVAEMTWGALRGVADGLYVNLGTGFATGIVAHGELLEGAHGFAGEAGYIVPSQQELRRYRPGSAPLEERIGGGAVPMRSRQEIGTALTMEELVQRARADEKLAAFLQQLYEDVGLWVANVAIVVDPAVVVLGGGFLRSGEHIMERVQEVMRRVMPFPPSLRRARFGADSALMGAGALALRSTGAL